MELVGPVAEEQHHALLAQTPREEVDERPRRAIGPVQILEDQHHRVVLAEHVEQLEQPFEQTDLPGRVVDVRCHHVLVEPRQQRRQLRPAAAAERVERRMAGANQWPQRADQRRVGKLTVGLLDGFAAEHERLILGAAALELPDQPGLADARLAAEQDHDRALPGRLTQREFQLREFPDATDEST